MNVSIVGSGYVGTTVAACLADLVAEVGEAGGHRRPDVAAADDRDVHDSITRGSYHSRFSLYQSTKRETPSRMLTLGS